MPPWAGRCDDRSGLLGSALSIHPTLIALSNFPVGPDKEAFHRYLCDFEAVDDEANLLDSLRDCNDVMPNQYADMLGLLPGIATYRDAIEILLCCWDTTFRVPDEHSSDEA